MLPRSRSRPGDPSEPPANVRFVPRPIRSANSSLGAADCVPLGSAVLVITLTGCAGANGDRSPVDAVVPPSGTGSAANSEQPTAPAYPVDLGPTPADEQVSFSVSLHLPAADAMTAYVAGLTQPGSASYHKYLSPPEFGAKFGLSDGEVARVVNWLSEAGLAATAKSVGASRRDGTKSRCCRPVTVANDQRSGIAAKQPNSRHVVS